MPTCLVSDLLKVACACESLWKLQPVVLAVVVFVEVASLELSEFSPLNSAWLLYLRDIFAPSTACISNEAVRAPWQPRRYPYTRNGGFTGLVKSYRPSR